MPCHRLEPQFIGQGLQESGPDGLRNRRHPVEVLVNPFGGKSSPFGDARELVSSVQCPQQTGDGRQQDYGRGEIERDGVARTGQDTATDQEQNRGGDGHGQSLANHSAE